VSAIRDGGTDIISYKWLGVGNPVDINYSVPATHLSYGTAADHYAGLDRFGRPVSIPWLKDGSPALVHAQYRYDRSSNRQWRRDAAAHAAGVATEDQWYEYDGLYQVGEFQRGTLSGSYPNFSGITPVAQNQDWNYDAMGNWLGFQSGALNQTRQFNGVNEITSINGPTGVVTPQYDPVGNMTTMPAVGNWTTAQTLKWDSWNRLVRVGEGSTILAEYTYDALFRRVTKTASGTTRRFYYSDQWQIIEEYVDSGTNPENRYWYGSRDLNDIARRQFYGATNTDLYTLRETMNVVALVNTSGAVQQRMAYDAFGGVRFLTASWGSGANDASWAMLFHAHYQDAETGLYQMRFRYYSPLLGVWLSRDPLREASSVNLYTFIGNSTGRIDFLGMRWVRIEVVELRTHLYLGGGWALSYDASGNLVRKWRSSGDGYAIGHTYRWVWIPDLVAPPAYKPPTTFPSPTFPPRPVIPSPLPGVPPIPAVNPPATAPPIPTPTPTPTPSPASDESDSLCPLPPFDNWPNWMKGLWTGVSSQGPVGWSEVTGAIEAGPQAILIHYFSKASRALTDCLAKHDFDDSCCELERRFLEAIKKGLRQ
jgi:RHS repeat-associated protein